MSAILVALLPLGCSNRDATLGVTKAPAGSLISFRRDVQPILSADCATAFCHGDPLAAPMSLSSSGSFPALVGIPSCEAPSLKRVEAGDSLSSYLVLKLAGTHSMVLDGGGCVTCDFSAGTVDNCGGRMPLGGPPYLSESTLQVIRDWIDQGAEDN